VVVCQHEGLKGKPQFNRSDRGLNVPKTTSIPKIPSSGVCFGGISKAGEQAGKNPILKKTKK
jgi:hypothetical protein